MYRALSSLPCVRHVDVDFGRKQATVTVISDQYDRRAILQVLEKEGYKAQVLLAPSTLILLHVAWAIFLSVVGIRIARKWQPQRIRRTAWLLRMGGLASLAILYGYELVAWYQSVPPDPLERIAPQFLYLVASTIYVPAVQATALGFILEIVAIRQRKRRASIAAATC